MIMRLGGMERVIMDGWMGKYIKFGVNPTSLSLSFPTHNSNDFIIKKKKLTLDLMVQSIQISETQLIIYNLGGSICVDGLDGS